MTEFDDDPRPEDDEATPFEDVPDGLDVPPVFDIAEVLPLSPPGSVAIIFVSPPALTVTPPPVCDSFPFPPLCVDVDEDGLDWPVDVDEPGRTYEEEDDAGLYSVFPPPDGTIGVGVGDVGTGVGVVGGCVG